MLEICHVCGNGIVTEADIFVFQHTPAGDLYAHADCYTRNATTMNSSNYVNSAMRTDTPITQELIDRVSNPETIRLLHAAIGMATEAGELLDMLKKHIFYGKPFDGVNAKEEVGDSMWYNALAVDVLKTTINEVMTANIGKLRLRYPEKFCEVKATNRNLTAERELLEGTELVKNIIIQEMGKEDVLVPVLGASKRGQDWIDFSRQVLMHIENYTVPQYGDKGQDQMTEWSIDECLLAVKKRLARYGKNSRENQQELDFKKMAHEIQIAYFKYEQEKN